MLSWYEVNKKYELICFKIEEYSNPTITLSDESLGMVKALIPKLKHEKAILEWVLEKKQVK